MPAIRVNRSSHFTQRAIAGLAAGLLLLSVSGCATVRRVLIGPSTEPSEVTILNQTDYAWQVAIVMKAPATSAMPKSGPVEVALDPRETRSVSIPPGTYAIEQKLKGSGGEILTTRSLEAEFLGGQSYRWPLMTLLSNPSDSAP